MVHGNLDFMDSGWPCKPWKPSDFDVEWLQKTVNYLKEGGVWATCLDNGNVAYEISHKKKRLLLVGNQDGDFLHERTTQVALLMGWEMMIPCKSCEDSGYERGKVECSSCEGWGESDSLGGHKECPSCDGCKVQDCIDCEGKGEQYE